MIVRVKTLYQTPKVHTTSSGMGDGKTYPVEAWFHLDLHEGPPDPTNWEGCGQTLAYWRDQFKRLKDPRRVTFGCHDFGGKPLPDVPEALLPNDVLDSLPEDARISFGWTVCRVKE